MYRLKKILPYLWITLAAAIQAVGFNWCFAPNNIAYGGLIGFGQIIHHFVSEIPVGFAVFVLNIPLFLLGWKLLGGRLLVTSLFAMSVSSVLIDILEALFWFPPMEPLLGGIYGGALVGLSLGMVFQVGSTTGGTDLIARLLIIPFPWLSAGKLLLAVDLISIASTAIAFRSLDAALYGVISQVVTAAVLDGVLYGLDKARVAYIISEQPQAIAAAIMQSMERGVTILKGQGAWSGQDKQILLVAFKYRQIVHLKRTIKELDPSAFLIVCEAHEVLGHGFHPHEKNI